MDFIHYTINWVKGEIFEMTLIVIAGFSLIALGIAFTKFGTTPLAKALFIPFLSLGILFSIIGISGYISNQQRLTSFAKEYHENASVFMENEKKRVEDFQYMYTITIVIAPVCFAIAVFLFWFTHNAIARAIGIALVIFGLSGLIIDSFSKERADLYYSTITKSLTSDSNKFK